MSIERPLEFMWMDSHLRQYYLPPSLVAAKLTCVFCSEEIREDWVLIGSDNIPSQEELVEDKKGYCYMM
jgi:hypothetical protein